MEDDYNFEDFEYEPEEIEKVEDNNIEKKAYSGRVNSKDKERDIANNNMKNNINVNVNANMNLNKKETDFVKKEKPVEDYGGFEDSVNANDSIEEVDDEKQGENTFTKQPGSNVVNTVNKPISSSNLNNYPSKVKDSHNSHNIHFTNLETISPNSNKFETVNSYKNKEPIITIKTPQIKKNLTNNYNSEKIKNLEESSSLSSILPNPNNHRHSHSGLINTNLPYEQHSKLNEIKGHNPMSRMQNMEKNYYQMKDKLDILFRDNITCESESPEDKNKAVESLSKQNLEMIKYLDKMNGVINVIIESSRVSNKNPNFSRKTNHRNNNNNASSINAASSSNSNHNKLLEVYKKEYTKLEERFKQIADTNYEDNIEETLCDLNTQMNHYEQENKRLKTSQKLSEMQFERNYKNNTPSSNVELKKINQDYENIKSLNDKVLEKTQKNKSQISDNENRLNELNEWYAKLETIARDMYGITNYETVKEEEKSEKKMVEKKQNLKKKMEVLEKVMNCNKRKYEGEITRNEKSIVNLEKNKIELMQLSKEKTILAYKTQAKVKGIYNQYDDKALLSHDVDVDNNDMLLLNKIINGIAENDTQNDQQNVVNGRSSNIQGNTSLVNESHTNASNESIIKKQSEMTKKEILKELEEKASRIPITNTTNVFNSVTSNIANEIGSNNNVSTRKPNFKFSIGNNTNVNNTPVVVSPNIKQMNIVENNESFNYGKRNVEINEEIISPVQKSEVEVEVKLERDRTKRNHTNEIPETATEEDNAALNVSRRRNNNNNNNQKENLNKSVLSPNNISQIINTSKTNIPLFLQDFHKKNEDNPNLSLLNNSIITNTESKANNNTNNTNTRRQKDYKATANSTKLYNEGAYSLTLGSQKRVTSIFDDPFKDDLDNKNKVIDDSIGQLNLDNIDDVKEINSNENAYDKKKKDDFDNLFKDDIFEVKSSPAAGNNLLLFGNNNNTKSNISSTGRNRDGLFNTNNNNNSNSLLNMNFNNNDQSIQNNRMNDGKISIKENKEVKKPKNIIDELEEIVL